MEWALRQVSIYPRIAMWACLLALTLLSMGFLAGVARGPDILAALCTPAQAGWPFAALMWSAMTLAMMLPAGAPMLSAYLDIADAARAKSMAIVPAFILAAGYAAVWLAVSLAAATLQTAIGPLPAATTGPLLILAGLYQFAPLKHACLTKCRQPMPYFLSRWTDRPSGVFRMGFEQGLLCLGCCWALMALGFAAGAMNPVWMAALGLIMILEKTLTAPNALVYGAGLGLTAAGAVMIVAA